MHIIFAGIFKNHAPLEQIIGLTRLKSTEIVPKSEIPQTLKPFCEKSPAVFRTSENHAPIPQLGRNQQNRAGKQPYLPAYAPLKMAKLAKNDHFMTKNDPF